MRTGTMSLNAPAGSFSSRIAPRTPPSSDAAPSRISLDRCPVSSARYPIAPDTDPGASPKVLDTLAVTGGSPTARSTGKVINVPEPTTVLIVPAHTPATNTKIACSGLIASATGRTHRETRAA